MASTRLPPIVPYPSHELRDHIPTDAWEACLDAWIVLGRAYLLVQSERFSDNLSPLSSLTNFLTSYVHENVQDLQLVGGQDPPKSKELQETVFLLVHRALTEARDVPSAMLEWTFLADFARLYGRYQATSQILSQTWLQHSGAIEKSVQSEKAALIVAEASPDSQQWQDVSSLTYLVRVMPHVGKLLLTGTDFLDSLIAAYSSMKEDIASQILALAYLSLLSLLQMSKPNVSLLVEQLYSLDSSAKQVTATSSNNLTISLVSDTPLLGKLRQLLQGPDLKRAQGVLDSLNKLARPPKTSHRKYRPPKAKKGKGRFDDHSNATPQLHPHRFSLITQIQDVFPDLGSLFTLRLLDYYNDNTESAIAALLEEDLPPQFADLDRSEQLPPTTSLTSDVDHHDDLIPHSPSPPPETFEAELPVRRNKYDNDAFDRLAVPSSQLHRGKSRNDATADDLLASKKDSSSHAKSKAAIFSALAAFDPDDDERDDTYDVEDVGGTVDAARPDDDVAQRRTGTNDQQGLVDEAALWRAFQSNAKVFERDARRGKERQALKTETGMTDEAIEGWATMLKRNPNWMRALEREFEGFSGQQTQLESTRWQRVGEDEGGESGSGQEGTRGRGGFRGRGRGRGRGGGSGRGGRATVAGPSHEKSTQIARERKEANKGSNANHNRRDQRAKKMARGGFAT
ncbi:MAG: hypothetical protein Q9162_003603 [Coniocarpon cinnabarinum]